MTIVLPIIVFIAVAVLLPVITGLLTEEVSAWIPTWAERIVLANVRHLPLSIQDEYRETWLGELDNIPGSMARLLFAITLVGATRKLNADYKPRRIILRRVEFDSDGQPIMSIRWSILMFVSFLMLAIGTVGNILDPEFKSHLLGFGAPEKDPKVSVMALIMLFSQWRKAVRDFRYRLAQRRRQANRNLR